MLANHTPSSPGLVYHPYNWMSKGGSDVLAEKGNGKHKGGPLWNGVAASAATKDGKHERANLGYWSQFFTVLLVPSQYLLVHKPFAAFGNSLFCLNVEPASLLRHVLKTEELYILHLRFTSSIKEIFNTYGCLGRDEIQVLKIFMDLTQKVYILYAVTSRTSDLQPMFSSKSPSQLMTTAVDRLKTESFYTFGHIILTTFFFFFLKRESFRTIIWKFLFIQ